jgi:hypothetical protein
VSSHRRLTYEIQKIGLIRPRYCVRVYRPSAVWTHADGTMWFDSETAALAYVASLGASR